jgi:threonine synthase
VWRYANELPVPREAAVTLGEGNTPIVQVPEFDACFKAEYLAPTGSFKDRGAAIAIAHAKHLGAKGVLEDSSGNAGAAVAAYAALAGLEARIVVPASIPAGKAAAIEALGAHIERVEGPRSAATQRALTIAKEGRLYYASHITTPWFFQGTKTAAYEVFEEGGPDGVDSIVTPTGAGTLLLGLAIGFRDLKRAGLISKAPRLYAVQAAGFTALADALKGAGPRDPPNRLADGVHIANPPRLEEMKTAIRETGGGAVTADEPETRRALDKLHRRGLLVEPTSALGLAGLERLRQEGLIEKRERALVMLTGRYKGPPA